MKKKRGFVVIGGIVLLCVLIGIYLVLKSTNKKEGTEEAKEGQQEEHIVSLETKDIESLTFRLDGREETWLQEEDGWSLKGQEELPVDAEKISTLTTAITSLKAGRTLEDIQNLQDYGLEEPVNTVKVKLKDGTTEKIHIGSKNPSTNDTYVCLNEEKDKVYTVADDLGTKFSGTIFSFAKGEEYPSLTASSIHKIEVNKKENSYTVESSEDSSTGWYVRDEAGDQKKASSTEVSSLQSTLAGLTFGGYYDYDCKDWSVYGLDQPQMELKITYTEQTETEEDSSEKELSEKELILQVGDLGEDGNYYVRMNDSKEVHGVSQSAVDTMKNVSAFDYWNTTMDGIALVDLDHLEVVYDGKTHILKQMVTEETEKKEGKEDDTEETVTTYYVDEKEADGNDFTSFYSASLGLICQERLEKAEPEGEPELTLIYVGKDGETITVTYTKRDANFYLAADSNGNYGLVNKMDVKELMDKLAKLI